MDLLDKLDVPFENLSEIRYRGNGWPGAFAVKSSDGIEKTRMSYMESWSFLQAYRPFRCQLCPDGLGELADVSCCDAWHQYNKDAMNPGLSLVMVRTKRGKEIIQKAREAGYLSLSPSTPSHVVKAQGLVERRKEIFGRQLAQKLLFVPPHGFSGFTSFHAG
jgi:coenzyme F420 hydrogenase subunit beta